MATHRGRKPSAKPGAMHLATLQQAHGKGDHHGAKIAALNYAKAMTQHLSGMASAPPDEPEPTNAPEETDPMTSGGSSGGNWIAGATKNKGALHRSLGVPQGQTIPKAKVAKAADSQNPTLAKRAQLAQTLAKLRKK